MITTKGKELIARYLSGHSSEWVGALEFGVGQTAPALADNSLEFPFVRVPVDYMDYNADTYVVTVRATLPQDVSGVLHEVGVFSGDFPNGEEGNVLLLDYTDEDTVYSGTNVATITENAKVGVRAYKLTAGVGETADLRGYVNVDGLEIYGGNDVFNLAYYYTDTGGTPSVNVRYESTLTDYFLHTFTPTAGYNIEDVEKQNLSQVGSPSWDTVSAVYVELDDQGELTLDGLAIKDIINNIDYGMVARSLISPELVKGTGTETDVTFDITLGF